MLAFIVLLRAAATILVINSHCDTIWPISALATGGSLGDSLFFSVSGFCLYKIKGKFLPWFIKRAIRIYPSVVVATVIISLFNGRSIFDNFFKLYIFPTGYSFIGALIIFYIVYYPIVKLSWKFEHIFSVLLSISALAYLVVYLKYTNISGWSIEGGWIKKVYWFQMFLLGGYIRLKYEEISQRLKRIKVLQLCGCCTVLFFIFYSLKAILVKYSKLQYQISIHIVEILFLLALLLLVIKLEPRLKQLQYKLIWKPIRFLSIITLENYLLMDVIIERCDSIVFPISVIIAFGGTFACAYLLHLFTDIPYKIVKKNGREMDISKWYRLERKLYLKHIPLVPKIIKGLIRILWGGGNPLSGGYRRGYTVYLSGFRSGYS